MGGCVVPLFSPGPKKKEAICCHTEGEFSSGCVWRVLFMKDKETRPQCLSGAENCCSFCGANLSEPIGRTHALVGVFKSLRAEGFTFGEANRSIIVLRGSQLNLLVLGGMRCIAGRTRHRSTRSGKCGLPRF